MKKIKMSQGDRLIVSAPLPGQPHLAVNVLEVIEVVEASGIRSAVAVLVRRNEEVLEDRPRYLITVERRASASPDSLPAQS